MCLENFLIEEVLSILSTDTTSVNQEKKYPINLFKYRISPFERLLSNDRLASKEHRVKRGHYDCSK